MVRLPSLEYGLTHPHPRGHWFLLATVLIFLLTLPVLVLVNLATLGSELVPSLQPKFQPNDTLTAGWWGNNRLPSLLRPNTPRCEPKDLGRGDRFRLSSSLFDYTVMSTWNTTEQNQVARVQEQKRAEYRGESFANCFVNNTRLDYNMLEQTEIATVGVVCPGTDDYQIFVSMETQIPFALELTKDFIGQYYGPGLDLLNLPNTSPSDYRKLVLAGLEVISTDFLAIIHGNHLSQPLLSMSLYFEVNRSSAALTPVTSTITYLNGSTWEWTDEAQLYWLSITNLAHVVNHAVNLDLGNQFTPNFFRNSSILGRYIKPNKPTTVNATDWVPADTQSFYYGTLNPNYTTWADALLHGWPVVLGNPTNLPDDSAMVTTYLCPMYQVKPTSSLLSSVFVGTATMILSVWGVWMFFTAYIAKRIMAPQVQCNCSACVATRSPGPQFDPEKSAGRILKSEDPPYVPANLPAERPTGGLDAKHMSYASQSTTGGS